VYVPSRRVLTISAIALTGELAIAGSTLLPDAPVVSIAVAAFVLFPIALAVFARTIWVGVRGGRRPALSDRLAGNRDRHVPRVLLRRVGGGRQVNLGGTEVNRQNEQGTTT
jgi:hypothetical protein